MFQGLKDVHASFDDPFHEDTLQFLHCLQSIYNYFKVFQKRVYRSDSCGFSRVMAETMQNHARGVS